MIRFAGKDNKAHKWISEVQDLFSKRKFEDAIKFIEFLLTEHSDLFHTWHLKLWLGRCYYEVRKFRLSVQCLMEARNELQGEDKEENKISYLQILDYLAWNYWNLSDYESAMIFLDEAEAYVDLYNAPEFKSDLYNFRILKGRVYVWLSKTNEAVSQFTLAKSLLPTDGSDQVSESVINFDIGRAYHYAGDQEKAGRQFRLVEIKNLPNDYYAEFYFYMSRFSACIEKYSDAYSYFKKLEAIGITENWLAEAYNIAGRSAFYLGKREESILYLQKSNQSEINHDWIKESNKKFLDEIGTTK